MTALYKIANEYQQAFNDLSANDELSAEIVADTLSGIEVEFEQKAKAIAAMILNLESDERAIIEVQRRLTEREMSLSKKIDRLKEYLTMNMHLFKKDNI
jgi:hypothetical protein